MFYHARLRCFHFRQIAIPASSRCDALIERHCRIEFTEASRPRLSPLRHRRFRLCRSCVIMLLHGRDASPPLAYLLQSSRHYVIMPFSLTRQRATAFAATITELRLMPPDALASAISGMAGKSNAIDLRRRLYYISAAAATYACFFYEFI